MTKEEFKDYLLEAVEAMDETELENLFPATGQPDLFTVVNELVGMRGEVKKLAGASLRINHDLQSLLEKQEIAEEEDNGDLAAENRELREELKMLLLQLLEQDDFIGKTSGHLEELPEPKVFSLSTYRTRLASWQKGFDITVAKWQVFVKSLGLYKTGLPGEPFNPQYHEAVEVKYDPAQPDNAILEAEVPGFLYKQQVLRLAKVVVNKHPEPKKETLPEAPVLPPPDAGPELPPEPPAAETPKKRREKSKRKSRRKKKKKKR
jgi:GrpE protein